MLVARVLVVVGGLVSVASLFLVWSVAGGAFFGNAQDLPPDEATGWQLFDWFDVVLVALGAVLALAATRPRPPRPALVALALLCAAAFATVVGHGFPSSRSGSGLAVTATEPTHVPFLALAGLALALVGLVLLAALRPRAAPRTASAARGAPSPG